MLSAVVDSSADSDEKKLTGDENVDTSTSFVVKVGDESFEVDRAIISSKSEYFAAMLAHDTLELHHGCVDMKEVTPYSVRQCLNFMLNESELDIDLRDALTAGDILHTAEIMQLPGLSQVCFEFLEKHLKEDNCMTVCNFATKYNNHCLEEKAQNMIKEVFQVDMLNFIQFSISDIVEFLDTHAKKKSMNSLVEAILTWIGYNIIDRERFVTQLFDHLQSDIFDSYLLRRLCNENIFGNSQACQDMVYEKIFMDAEAFHSKMSIENFFIIKKISEEFRFIPKQVKKRLADFMTNNFIALSSQPEFLHLTEEHFLKLFSNDEEDYLPPEKCKWNAAIRWIRYDNRRLSVLPTIMKTIKFDFLSKTFIATNIRNEPLVKASSECSKLLMDSMFMDKPERNPKTFIAVLYSESRIAVYDCANNTWDEIPNVPKGSTSMICSFNDKLCLLVDEKLYFLNKNQKWISMGSGHHNLGTNDRVTAADDSIYIIDETYRYISEYNANTDSWNRSTLQEHLPDWAIVTSSFDGCLCFFDDGHVKMFDVGKLKWTNHATKFSTFSMRSAARCNKIIYCISNEFGVKTFDPKTQTFQDVKAIPSASRIGTKIGGCILVKITPAPRKAKLEQWAFIVDGKLVVADGKNDIYVYVDLCKQWLKMTSIPLYAGKLDKKSTILSVCSFIKYS